MKEFLIISIVVILLFGTIRRFIFFNTQDAFKKAAEDFYKKQELEERKRKASGKITVEKSDKQAKVGEYVSYEEVKD